jgi:predicted permease
MEGLYRDLRYALRVLAGSPGVAAVAIIALALGIGANTAIFSVVNAVLLRPLPYPDEDRLVQIWGSTPSQGVPFHNVFYSDALAWGQQSRSFDAVVSCSPGSGNLILGEEPERLAFWRVNAGFFSLFGAKFACGRGFLPAEDAPGAARVMILSYGLWQRRFGSNPNVVGTSVNLDGNLYTVTGILSADFHLIGRTIDAFAPLALAGVRNTPGDTTVSVFACLKPGVTKQQAQTEMSAVGRNLGEQFPNSIGKNPRIWGLREFVVRDVRLSLFVLLAGVGLVLLIACVNVANLLLSRAAARQREIAVRTSLGASRGRIIRQLLTESGILGLAGGTVGVLLAHLGVRALLALVPERYPLLKDAAIDAPVLLFTLVTSLLTSVLFGLAPAIVSSRAGGLPNALKEGTRGSGEGSKQIRLLSLLVVAEVALALILLVGAGLLIRSFLRLNEVKPGFSTRNVLTASINLPQAKYSEAPKRVAFFNDLLLHLQAIPGVQCAGLVSALPLTQYNTGIGLVVEGRPFPRPDEVPIVWFRIADEGYFRTMEIPLMRGRTFNVRDDTNAPPVAIINETMARRFWPNEDPLGKRFTSGLPRSGRPITWITIVGVAGDLRHKNLDQEPDAEVFWPFRQLAPAALSLTVRTTTDPTRFAPLLRTTVADLDREQPVSQIRSMEQIFADSIAPRRFSVTLLGIFALVALALAAVGIYGVVSFSVTRRTQEIGVRMALGAQRGNVLRMVVGRALAMAAVGVITGLVGSLALTRIISSLLFGVSSTDPTVFAGVSLLLMAIAGLAGFFPARRASLVDPLVALRNE